MLLGARQFFERRGAPTPPLPYDAEVEYLESTGTQWIDTGIRGLVTGADYKFILRTQFLDSLQSNYAGHGYSTYIEQSFIAANSSNGIYMSFANSSVGSIATNITSQITSVHTYTALCRSGELSYLVDDMTVLTKSGVGSYNLKFFDLFRIVNDFHVATGRIGNIRLFSALIDVAEEKIIDFIPVRFTNEQGVSEGAMYDRVSGQLFRNAGTGAFTIGPDK